NLVHLFLVGVNLHLAFVEDGAEVLMVLGMQEDPDVLQAEALFHRGLADAVPGDVPLPDVHDALGVVHQVVNLPLQDGLEVGLKAAARYFHQHGQGQPGRDLVGGQVGDVLADDFHLAVFHFIHVFAGDQLHRLGLAATALQIEVVLADPLALEGSAEVHRDVDLGDRDLEAPDFDGFLAQLLHVDVAHHVLIGADTGGQHLGDVLVGDGGKAPVDGAGGVGVPLVGDFGYRIDKGKDAVLVVKQHLQGRSRFDAAKGHGGPVGEAQGEDRPGDIRAEGHDPGGPAHLDPGFQELFRHRGLAVNRFGGAEDVEVLFLVFRHQVH